MTVIVFYVLKFKNFVIRQVVKILCDIFMEICEKELQTIYSTHFISLTPSKTCPGLFYRMASQGETLPEKVIKIWPHFKQTLLFPNTIKATRRQIIHNI